ncbi:hypothetical protein GCM10023189_39760 [Nibrella saemangeumensis]|uniref:NfeD-like C-terminal domain-containing protein n=1 Tax=Nibrella saemangeumensis TaxID=1084526 RepID=A0ABP8NAP3_9BACT
MDFLTLPEFWAVMGLVFLIIELLTVSFFFAFLGTAALITALASWMGLTPELNSQLLCFSIISIVTLVAFRQSARRWFDGRKRSTDYVEYIGDRAKVTLTIPANGEGRIFYRGAEWIARSRTGQTIAEGASVIIRQLDGIRLIVDADL